MYVAPSVSVTPSILAVLPSDIRVTISCETNSPALPVVWLSALNSTESLSTRATYTFSVPSQGGFSNGQNFYCVVRNPEVSDNSPTNIVGSAFIITLNIIGKWIEICY